MTDRSRWMLICGVYSLIVWGSCEALEARLRGSVELPCMMKLGTYRIEELLVYWQRQLDGEVVLVAAVVHGKEGTEKQHTEYKGRAFLSPSGVGNGDFTLHLSDLSLKDSGTYHCYVFWDHSSYITLLENTEELHVTAEYSTPVITSPMPEERIPELTLTCSTQGGIPAPEIRWINASDWTPIHEGQIHTNIDQDGDFINVTSSITINVTSTTNISCVILTGSGNLTSDTYVLEVTDGRTERERQHAVAPALRDSVIIMVIVIIAALVGIAVLKRRFFCSAGSSRQVEYQQGKAETA